MFLFLWLGYWINIPIIPLDLYITSQQCSLKTISLFKFFLNNYWHLISLTQFYRFNHSTCQILVLLSVYVVMTCLFSWFGSATLTMHGGPQINCLLLVVDSCRNVSFRNENAWWSNLLFLPKRNYNQLNYNIKEYVNNINKTSIQNNVNPQWHNTNKTPQTNRTNNIHVGVW